MFELYIIPNHSVQRVLLAKRALAYGILGVVADGIRAGIAIAWQD